MTPLQDSADKYDDPWFSWQIRAEYLARRELYRPHDALAELDSNIRGSNCQSQQ